MDIQEKKRTVKGRIRFKRFTGVITCFVSSIIFLILLITAPIRSCCRYSNEYDKYFDSGICLGKLVEFNPLSMPGKPDTPDSLMYVRSDSSIICLNITHLNGQGYQTEEIVKFPIRNVRWIDSPANRVVFVATECSLSSRAWNASGVHIEDTLQGIDMLRKIAPPSCYSNGHKVSWGEEVCPKCGRAVDGGYTVYIYCTRSKFGKYVRREKRK